MKYNELDYLTWTQMCQGRIQTHEQSCIHDPIYIQKGLKEIAHYVCYHPVKNKEANDSIKGNRIYVKCALGHKWK